MYRGGVGQWSWMLHRVTGVGILLFLIIHVIDTALIMWGPTLYNHVLELYRHPLFRPMEIFLFASVLFHALNGVRVIIVDVWSEGARYHRQLFYIVMLVFWPILCYGSYVMLKPLWL